MQDARTRRDQSTSTLKQFPRDGTALLSDAGVQGRNSVSLVLGLWFIILTLIGCAHVQSIVNIRLIDEERFQHLWRVFNHCRCSTDLDEMREDLQWMNLVVGHMKGTKKRPSFLPESVQHPLSFSCR